MAGIIMDGNVPLTPPMATMTKEATEFAPPRNIPPFPNMPIDKCLACGHVDARGKWDASPALNY